MQRFSAMTPAQYTEQSRAAYEEALSFDDTFTLEMSKDSEAVFKRLPDLKEWRDKLEKQAVAQLREKGKLRGKIQKEMQPVLHIVGDLPRNFSFAHSFAGRVFTENLWGLADRVSRRSQK